MMTTDNTIHLAPVLESILSKYTMHCTMTLNLAYSKLNPNS